MGQDTKIQWCHHTFNPVIGCSKVSDGCKHCYAEDLMDRRYGKAKWGKDGTRVVTSDANWKQPFKWDREAAKAGERRRVFCASLSDVFEDREEWIEPRARLWRLILSTPNLDWLLLTKRPEYAANWLDDNVYGPAEFGDWTLADLGGGPVPNVWLGTSIENQATADERIPHLLSIPAAVRFLSIEPLLGPVDLILHRYDVIRSTRQTECDQDVLRGTQNHYVGGVPHSGCLSGCIDWVIIGGESGSKARPCDLAWIRSIRDQCQAAGVACFVKQLGARPMEWELCGLAPNSIPSATLDYHLSMGGSEPDDVPHWLNLRDSHGGDPSEWPEDLRIRELPRVTEPATP